jgi:hypothetical protein
MKNKQIGILGSGMVGQALAEGFLKYKNRVMVGSGSPLKLEDWKSNSGKGAFIGSFAETASFGDIIILAVKGSAALDVLELAGSSNLKGKTIIDATNPIDETPPENGVLKFFTDVNESLMEQLQKACPEAHFVKAYNSVGSAFMVDPPFDQKPTMFICGNNDKAKKETSKILNQFGWDSEDMGTATSARAIEPLCILWCIPGIRENKWTHAFKLLKL